MGKKLYMANLGYGVTDSALEQLFAAQGTVQSAQVILDRDTGRSRGFGVVEMNPNLDSRANQLLSSGAYQLTQDTLRTSFEAVGKPEPLKRELAGYCPAVSMARMVWFIPSRLMT
jgi:RNA recognition motif-containing protein